MSFLSIFRKKPNTLHEKNNYKIKSEIAVKYHIKSKHVRWHDAHANAFEFILLINIKFMNKVSQNRWKTPTRLRNNWQLLSGCVALRVSHTRTYKSSVKWQGYTTLCCFGAAPLSTAARTVVHSTAQRAWCAAGGGGGGGGGAVGFLSAAHLTRVWITTKVISRWDTVAQTTVFKFFFKGYILYHFWLRFKSAFFIGWFECCATYRSLRRIKCIWIIF